MVQCYAGRVILLNLVQLDHHVKSGCMDRANSPTHAKLCLTPRPFVDMLMACLGHFLIPFAPLSPEPFAHSCELSSWMYPFFHNRT